MTSMSTRAGASHADLCELLTQYAEIIRDTPRGVVDHDGIADTLRGFADTLGNLADHVVTRDVLTVAEHRREIGICEDGGDHWDIDCYAHGCPTWAKLAGPVARSRIAEMGV